MKTAMQIGYFVRANPFDGQTASEAPTNEAGKRPGKRDHWHKIVSFAKDI